MANLVLVADAESKFNIHAIGDFVTGNDSERTDFRVTSLYLEAEASNTTLVVDAGSRIDIPKKLLTEDGGNHRFATRAELGDLAADEWSALRERVRQRLSQPLTLSLAEHTFFGVSSVGGAALRASVLVSPAILEGTGGIAPDSPVLTLAAEGSLQFSYALQDYAELKLDGQLKLKAVMYRRTLQDVANTVIAALDIDIPRLPGFDLKLDGIALPKLSFEDIEIDIAKLTGWFPSLFATALPSFGDSITFALTTAPKFALSVTGGELGIATSRKGSGEFRYRDDAIEKKLAGVDGLALTLDKGQLAFNAVVAPAPASYVRNNITIDEDWLPFKVSIATLKVSATIAPGDLADLKPLSVTIRYELGGLRIFSRSEPDLFITLDVSVTTTSSGDGLATTVDRLAVVAPYPLELIGAATSKLASAVGELIRIVGPFRLPAAGAPDTDPVKRLLVHLGRMLASAVEWLASKTGAAAGLLAGLLEPLVKALGRLLEVLAKAGDAVFSHVIVELRLDPKTFQLRQVVLQTAGMKDAGIDFDMSAAGFDLHVAAGLEPALVLDLGPEQWFGLVVKPSAGAALKLGTDLWLNKETGPRQPMGVVDDPNAGPGRLIVLGVEPGAPADDPAHPQDLVVVALQRGRLRLFQKMASSVPRADATSVELNAGPQLRIRSLCQSGQLVDATIGSAATDDLRVTYKGDIAQLKQRMLALLPKTGTPADSSGGGALDALRQKIEIVDVVAGDVGGGGQRNFRITLKLRVHLEESFAPETDLSVLVDLRDLSVTLSGGDRIVVKGKGRKTYSPFGMELLIRPKDGLVPREKEEQFEYEQFYLELAHGGESMGLGNQAVAELSYGAVSSSGKGLQFRVPVFRVGRGGIDLEAHIQPEPVTLGGVDVPFKFDTGHVAIAGSRFSGGSLTGSGQLPQALIGEANASIALTLGARDDGEVVVEAATARIDKSGDPIRCSATRFDLTITELGFDFVREGGYHFFFLLTGSASFNPGKGEFSSGLMKHFGGVEIKLDKAPLAADPRVLMRAMSFKVKVDPVKTIKAFDIFSFELRSFGYHPASPQFDGDPAMSIGGQFKFLNGGDKPSVRMDFHDLWCSFGEGKPRFRCDGLTVGLAIGSVKVEGTAIAVDGSLPTLYRPGVLPSNVTAHGFLASGRIEFPGWSPLTAAMGFLELRKKALPDSEPRHAFFIYGQLEKQTEPIDTPVGRIYLREYGFGFGYRYTLAGIAQAETAKSPNELVRILDDVSKYQGNLDRFEAWEPTYDNADLTFALRGMLSMAAASERGKYNDDKEKDIPNPLLLDIVAALRTDLTFLVMVRAWVAVNYHDWATSSPGDDWRSNPTMRGYLYFSVPRKEFLGRFVANKAGHIGLHPKLPEPLVKAIRGTDFSATLYIRPGLFHFELGWPFELGVQLGEPGSNFHMKISGGLIQRMEDFSVLYGMAFRAVGAVHLEGRFGSSSFGAAAVAHADFAIEAKILAFLSLRAPGESMYYGELRIDVTVHVSVEVWLSFKVFGHRITLSTGFSLDLAVSIALEAVLSASQGLGGRASVAVGICAFGRSASIGIGFSFNNGLLAEARARVARYSAMGLAAPVPDRVQDSSRVDTNPQPQPPRSEAATVGDEAIDNDLGNALPEDAAPDPDAIYYGRPIRATDFWAMLFPTAAPAGETGDWYLMQLVPRDHTPIDGSVSVQKWDEANATFYTSPRDTGNGVFHTLSALEGEPLPAGAQIFAANRFDGPVDPASGAPWGMPFEVYIKGVVQAEDPVKGTPELNIGKLLEGLFLDHENGANAPAFGEPRARRIGAAQDPLQQDPDSSARRLARSGRTRSNLDGLAKREAEIEESRSAVLASVVDSAAQLARQGIAGGKWPARHPEIDARDFGLTFMLNREAIDALFEARDETKPRRGRFYVGKSDVGGAATGTVLLFNPPARMFREAQPSFAPTCRIEAQGIKLDWNLEPAWGNSKGAYHDPEFHLKHYRVVRIIENLGSREYKAEFTVKAAAPITILHDEYGDHVGAIFMRPPFQFIDDLRKQGNQGDEHDDEDVPEALRLVLLGQGKAEDLTEEWNGIRFEDVRISYEIYAVDIAGTSDAGRPYAVSGFTRPLARPLSPREATLQLSYSRFPDFPGPAVTPVPRLLLRPGVKIRKGAPAPQLPEANEVYQLRILSEPARASGSYGTDAIDVAGRRLDEQGIDKLAGDDVTNFILTVKAWPEDQDKGRAPLVTEWLPEGGRDQDRLLRYNALVVQRISGTKLEAASMADIARTLGTDLRESDIGLSHRVFLRRVDAPKDGTLPAPLLPHLAARRHGEWRTANVNIVLADSKETRISAVVEEFEQPVHIAYRALTRTDLVHGESGRLHLIQPAAGSTLAMLLDLRGKDDVNPFATLRDPARRTAARLTWKALPGALRYLRKDGDAGAPGLHRWVGGFDLHVIDADGVPEGVTDGAALAPFARHLGRISLLPPTLAQLDPPGFGDFGTIESAYPSDTLRQEKAPAGTSGPSARKAAWYSAAESTAVFPRPAIRRSLMPDPDEDQLAALFAGGTPVAIRVSIPDWYPDPVTKHADPLPAWSLVRVEDAGLRLRPCGPYATIPATGPSVKTACFALDPMDRGQTRITIALVRDLLQCICLMPKPEALSTAYENEEAVLQQRLEAADYLAAVTVRVEALQGDLVGPAQVLRVSAAQECLVDIAPPLHPVLADTLALLAYASLQRPAAGAGDVFRRYSIVPDTVPEPKARSFRDWLDEAPPERDPQGWAALRTVGLAAGLRLYDSEEGDYVKGEALLAAVNSQMARALERYADPDPDTKLPRRHNGQPFVDILTRPWGNARLFWFDGGYRSPDPSERNDLVGKETLAVVQIALRPAPDRMVAASPLHGAGRLVHYFAMTVHDAPPNADWTIELVQPEGAQPFRFDVLSTVESLVSRHPTRLGKSAIAEVRTQPRAPGRVAFIRGVRIGRGTDDPVALAESLLLLRRIDREGGTPKPAGFKLVPMELAVQQHGADGKDVADPVFGKFADLSGEDWASALFRPQLNANATAYDVSAVEAFKWLFFYAGRRFAPIVPPQGESVFDNEILVEDPKATQPRAELAGALARFWLRYIEHCTAYADPSAQIGFSLGTLADPGQWRCAPDVEGTVSVLIPETSRRGARRKYALRPFGRYESWIKAGGAADGQQHEIPPSLDGALLPKAASEQFFDITLPRTEPLEKPVILSALRHAPDGTASSGRLELVVAHGLDMVLGQANGRNDAQLAPLDISVGYWRQFAHAEWLRALAGLAAKAGVVFDPLAPFGNIDDVPADALPKLNQASAASRLLELRQRVPDAWLGATMVTAVPPPYFFKVHALVHSSAGIVLSEQTGTTFGEGASTLRFAHDEGDHAGRTRADAPFYEVVREGNNEDLVLQFDLPASRFIDCMHAPEAIRWFGRSGEHGSAIRPVAYLPEPGVSYRIAVETAVAGGPQDDPVYEPLARETEVDLLPAPPQASDTGAANDPDPQGQGLYLVQRSGSRLRLARIGEDTGPIRIDPLLSDADALEWRIRLALYVDTPALPRPLSAALPPHLDDAMMQALEDLPAPALLPRAIDALRQVTLTKGAPAADWAARWEAAAALFQAKATPEIALAPEALTALRAWKTEPPEGTVLELAVPAGLADDAQPLVEALSAGAPQWAARIGSVVLRRAPADSELATVAARSAELAAWLASLAQRQLLGEGRRLVLSAMKGTARPVVSDIRRKQLPR